MLYLLKEAPEEIQICCQMISVRNNFISLQDYTTSYWEAKVCNVFGLQNLQA